MMVAKFMLDSKKVREQIHHKMKLFGITQKEYAKQHGYSLQYLNDFLNGGREPGPKILKGEGLRRLVYYEDEP